MRPNFLQFLSPRQVSLRNIPFYRKKQLSVTYLLLTTVLLASFAMLLLGPALTQAESPSGVDSFDTEQARLKLTAPKDIGKTASSVVLGDGILGGERDLEIALTGKQKGTSLKAGVGSGDAPDTAVFGDEGSNTLSYNATIVEVLSLLLLGR